MSGLISWRKWPGARALILITNVVYIASILLKMYISNPSYFFENAFQTINLFFYLCVLLTYVFIKNVKLYFLSSLLLILDLPLNLKANLQDFLVYQLQISNIRLAHLALLALLALVVFIVCRYKITEYLQMFLLFFYVISLFVIVVQTKRIYSSPLKISGSVNTISKNYYFLLFDEYPNEQVIKKYDLCDKSDYPSSILSVEGFTCDQHSYSNYISTVRSTINFLTGSFQAKYNINNAIHALDSNVFTRGTTYSFTAFSVLDDRHRPNSLLPAYYFYTFNNLLVKTIIPWLVSLVDKRNAGDFTDCDAYNADAVAKLSALSKIKRTHLAYIHFFTPHYYPIVNNDPISQRIRNADQWMLDAIHVLNRNDPSAGVIIFSDHGLRKSFIPVKQWNRNILYFRNVTIDTGLVNKNGLVYLTKSIKY